MRWFQFQVSSGKVAFQRELARIKYAQITLQPNISGFCFFFFRFFSVYLHNIGKKIDGIWTRNWRKKMQKWFRGCGIKANYDNAEQFKIPLNDTFAPFSTIDGNTQNATDKPLFSTETIPFDYVIKQTYFLPLFVCL